MRVLVVNAGSSSLKLRMLDAHDTVEHRADLPAGREVRQVLCSGQLRSRT